MAISPDNGCQAGTHIIYREKLCLLVMFVKKKSGGNMDALKCWKENKQVPTCRKQNRFKCFKGKGRYSLLFGKEINGQHRLQCDLIKGVNQAGGKAVEISTGLTIH